MYGFTAVALLRYLSDKLSKNNNVLALKVNDISLPWGGRLNINGEFPEGNQLDKGHVSHRMGTGMDIIGTSGCEDTNICDNPYTNSNRNFCPDQSDKTVEAGQIKKLIRRFCKKLYDLCYLAPEPQIHVEFKIFK